MLRRKPPSPGNEEKNSYNVIPEKKWIQGGARNRVRMIFNLLICVGGVACCLQLLFIVLRFCLPAQFDPDRLIATERILLHHPSPGTLHDSKEIHLFQSLVQIPTRNIPHQNGRLLINTVEAIHRTHKPNNSKVIVLLHGVRVVMCVVYNSKCDGRYDICVAYTSQWFGAVGFWNRNLEGKRRASLGVI